MGILYLKEHISCYNYKKCVQEGFLYYEFREKEIVEETNEANCIIFVMEGELEVLYNGRKINILSGNMICIARGCVCKIYSPKKGSAVIAQFENVIQGCDKIVFSQLFDLTAVRKEVVLQYPLKIRYQLQLYLELLIGYLKDGANCVHFHEIKLKELLWNIRFYYTKTELAAFFSPLLGNDYKFRNLVLNNYKNTRTVKELARLCGISLSSFKRKFLKEFREPASDWLHKQINREIIYRLADKDISIGEIADELNFSSQPQFCRYCKRNFGYTPGECRRLLKKRNKTIGIHIGKAQLN